MTGAAKSMIEICRLSVVRGAQTICSVSELRVAAGERVAIIGANGTGKTTLLRALCGLEDNYGGSLVINVPPAERVYVHQSPYLFQGTALFNTCYGLRARGANRADRERLARRWLDRLGLGSRVQSRVDNLSGGERRRVALARAMILQPRLLLLDEPLADLDAHGTAAVMEALSELTQSTVLVASPNSLPQGIALREHVMSKEG